MKRNTLILASACLQSLALFSTTSVFDMRRKSSSTLLYSMIDLSGKDYHLEFAGLTSRSFDSDHIASALTMNGKSYFTLNEQGATATSQTVDGDMSPKWISLTTTAQDYKSIVELKPTVRSCGVLLHFYKKCSQYFVNIQSAILRCRSQVEIDETLLNGVLAAAATVTTFEEAVNHTKWNYGKMGSAQTRKGLDNIQMQLGAFVGGDSDVDRSLALSLLFEIPTGKGTKAEWAFEPRVGGNHFGLGFGFDDFYKNETSQVVVGANYRFLFGATEKRSFDLDNNPWSRYVRVVSIPTDAGAHGTESPGINALTLDATVTPGHQVNSYLRWSKRCNNVHFELGYNFLFKAKEKISNIADFSSEFGIADKSSISGLTVNKSKMNTNLTNNSFVTSLSQSPGVAIVKDDLDVKSAAAGTQLVSSASARLEYVGDVARFGCGASVEGAHSKNAYAAWNFWVNAGARF